MTLPPWPKVTDDARFFQQKEEWKKPGSFMSSSKEAARCLSEDQRVESSAYSPTVTTDSQLAKIPRNLRALQRGKRPRGRTKR